MERLERKWWTLIAVCTAIFMLLLDITAVNVALPDMERDLDASFGQLQWVVDAYALTLATTVLAADRRPTSSAGCVFSPGSSSSPRRRSPAGSQTSTAS